MTVNEAQWIVIAVLGVWNLVLTVAVAWAFSDLKEAAALGWKAMKELNEHKSTVNEIGKELFDYIGVKLIRWQESVPMKDFTSFGPFTYCKTVDKYALVRQDVQGWEVDKIKNASSPEPEED